MFLLDLKHDEHATEQQSISKKRKSRKEKSLLKRPLLSCITSEEGRRKNYAITEEGKNALHLEYRRLKQLVTDGAILEEVEE